MISSKVPVYSFETLLKSFEEVLSVDSFSYLTLSALRGQKSNVIHLYSESSSCSKYYRSSEEFQLVSLSLKDALPDFCGECFQREFNEFEVPLLFSEAFLIHAVFLFKEGVTSENCVTFLEIYCLLSLHKKVTRTVPYWFASFLNSLKLQLVAFQNTLTFNVEEVVTLLGRFKGKELLNDGSSLVQFNEFSVYHLTSSFKDVKTFFSLDVFNFVFKSFVFNENDVILFLVDSYFTAFFKHLNFSSSSLVKDFIVMNIFESESKSLDSILEVTFMLLSDDVVSSFKEAFDLARIM